MPTSPSPSPFDRLKWPGLLAIVSLSLTLCLGPHQPEARIMLHPADTSGSESQLTPAFPGRPGLMSGRLECRLRAFFIDIVRWLLRRRWIEPARWDRPPDLAFEAARAWLRLFNCYSYRLGRA